MREVQSQFAAAAGCGNNLVGAQNNLVGALMGDCARQTAKDALRGQVRRLRAEADRLEALAGALPEKLPRDADEALWDLLIRR